MSYDNLHPKIENATIGELKAIATSKNIIPTGDKRLKQTWIDALESLQLVNPIESN